MRRIVNKLPAVQIRSSEKTAGKALLSGNLISRIGPGRLIAQLLGKGEGLKGMGIPAGIEALIQAFQDQGGAAGGSQPFPPEGFCGVNFDFNAVFVPGIGGGTGNRFPVCKHNYAKAQTPVGVPVGKLGHQVPGPALCLALVVNVLVYRMKGAAGGEAFTDGQKLLCGKGFRVLLRGIPGDGLCRLLKDADNGQIPAVRLGNQDLKGVLFTVDFSQKRKAGRPREKYEIAQHGHG